MIPPRLAESYRRHGYWLPETIPARFRRVCGENSDRAALIDGTTRLSFTDVLEHAERLAGHLASLGVARGDVVSWQLPGWWEAGVVHHAALLAGAVPNPLNPIFRGRELRFILAEAQPHVLFVPASFREFDHAQLASEIKGEIASPAHVITVRGASPGCLELTDLLEQEATPPADSGESDSVALLLYTSGTTSDPKGVLHSHETLLYEINSLRDVHALTPQDRYLAGSPVAHIAGLVYGLLMPFVLGTSTVLMERWDPAAALGLIERERVTFQTGAPAFLQMLAAHAGSTDTSSFRLFSTGGASIPTEAVRDAAARLGCVVKRAYGSTEVPTLTATRFDDPPEFRIGTDGRVIDPAEMRIVRRDGSDAPTGEEGEIWARSPEVFLGYRNTALDDFDPDGWYRTGDLGVLDGGGNLRVTGRLKDIIIRGGENISAKEIEDLLLAHPAVAEAAVIGVPDPVLGERACAVVVPRAGAQFDFDEMVGYLSSQKVAKQKFPERLELRDVLPRTESGKVIKTMLRREIAGES